MRLARVIGLSLLVWVGSAGAARMLCDGSAIPSHDETLSPSGDGVTYLFDEDYNFTDGVLGDWASKTTMYVCSQWPEMAADAITPPD